MSEGVQLLRRKRGDQGVTFADVCDHLQDFLRRRPEHAAVIDALATFLAGVEDVDHEHGDGADTTPERHQARDVPA